MSKTFWMTCGKSFPAHHDTSTCSVETARLRDVFYQIVGKDAQIQISFGGLIVIKMKLEFVDIAVALVALSMLGGFAILQNPVFLYVFFVLVAAEILGIFVGRKKTSAE